jgi:hypothetical protein
VQCDVLRHRLVLAAFGERELDATETGHVGCCFRCQAELARAARLRRRLAELRAEQLPPPEHLLGDVLAALAEAREPDSRLAWRLVYLVGAAGAAGVVVLAGRTLSRGRLAS